MRTELRRPNMEASPADVNLRSADTEQPRRSRKPPWVYARVVKASAVLSLMQKLVWLEHYGLACGPDGLATISASGLGRRLAVSRVTVERVRMELLRMGLLGRRDRGPGKTAAWSPNLPARCRPQSARLTDDDTERYAELLDDMLRGSVSREIPHEPHSPHEGGYQHEREVPGRPK
jgi:hypothetical protein